MVDFYYIFFHAAFVSIIAILIYVLIGSFTRRFGERHYQSRKRYLPFLIFPRTERNYAIAYRLVVAFALICIVVLYGLFLRFGL